MADDVAGEVSTGLEDAMKVLPFLGTLIGFIPGAQVAPEVAALVTTLLGQVDAGLKTVSEAKPGTRPQDILTEVINHNTPGAPNSPWLS
jgi:hypothetical protein